MTDPLPDLCARNFSCRSVLHQMKKRHRAMAAQPRFQILDADRNILAQSGFSDRSFWSEIEKVPSGDVYVFAFAIDLIGSSHLRVECISRQLHHPRVRD